MAKKEYTFADEAKAIMRRFPRRETDPIEKQDYEQAMEELVQMQEQVRSEMGLNSQQQEYKCGGNMKYDNGGPAPLTGDNNNSYIKQAEPWYKQIPINMMGVWKSSTYPEILTSLYNKTIGAFDYDKPYIGGVAPAPTRGTAIMNPSAWKYGQKIANLEKARAAKTIKHEADIMNKLIQAPGNLAKEYPTGVRNLSQLKGNTSNIHWKNIGYGAAGTGILGAGIYGLTQLPDGTVVDGQGNIVNNNETLGANALQEWSPQGIGDIIDLSPNNSRAMDSDKGLTDINRLNSQIPQTTIPIKKGTVSTTNVTVPTAKTTTNQYNPTSRLVTNTAEIQPQSIPKLDREITPYEMKILGANEMNKIKNRTPDESKQEQSWWDKNKRYAPYAISGLSNIASNVLLANMAKRNKSTYSPVTSTPETLNMEPYAEQLRKDAGVTKNVAMRNARNLGLNAGATLANMGAVGADVDRNLGANLTNLYGQQEQYNARTANQFNLANVNAINQGRMFNTQADLANKEAQLGYLSGALGTLPGVMKDIRMDKADKEMRDMYSAYYKSMGRNYMNEGDIWDNPKDGFKYVVRNNELVKLGKSK